MKGTEFIRTRKTLKKTQKELAELLGKSIKAIHSYEQGWREVPPHVEANLMFLLSRHQGLPREQKPCWVIKKCPAGRKKNCPAWEFQTGKLCWLIGGTKCEGKSQATLKEKIKFCRECEVLQSLTTSWE